MLLFTKVSISASFVYDCNMQIQTFYTKNCYHWSRKSSFSTSNICRIVYGLLISQVLCCVGFCLYLWKLCPQPTVQTWFPPSWGRFQYSFMPFSYSSRVQAHMAFLVTIFPCWCRYIRACTRPSPMQRILRRVVVLSWLYPHWA